MFKAFCIYIFFIKTFSSAVTFQVLETNSTIEYSERLYYIPLAFPEGYFCNMQSRRKSSWANSPANIRLDEDVLKTLFVFVFRRRLDQDENIRLTHSSSEDVWMKTK